MIDRTKQRIVDVVQTHNNIIEKKKKHTFRCKEAIEGSEKSIKEAKKEIQLLNRRAKKLSKKFEEILSKMIKRKVQVTGLGS